MIGGSFKTQFPAIMRIETTIQTQQFSNGRLQQINPIRVLKLAPVRSPDEFEWDC